MRLILERHPLAAAVGYTVVGVIPMYLTSAQTVFLQRDLGFGPAEFGIIVSSFFLVSSIASRLVGPWLDRHGAARGLRISMALSAISCTLIATMAGRWEMIAVFLALAGFANACGQIGSNLIVAHLVRARRQGVAFSAKQSAIPLSAMLSGFVIPIIGGEGTWRWSYFGVAAIALLLLVSCPPFEAAVAAPRETGERQRLPLALVMVMLAGVFAGGSGNAFANFATDAAVANGYAPAIAALLLTAGSLTAIVVRISAGLSADRRQRSGFAETAGLIAVGVAGFLLLASAGGSPAVFLIGLLATFAGAWGWQGVVAYLVIRTIDRPAATATGAVWSGVFLGTVLVPFVVGYLVERASYPVVFMVQAGLMTLALLCLTASYRLSTGARRRGGAGEASSLPR